MPFSRLLSFDPRVQYDHFSRFLMLWHNFQKLPNASYYLFSVSSTDDPTGEWASLALPADIDGSIASGTWADNGCLGFDSSSVFIVSNQYTFSTMEPKDVRVRILSKESLLSDKGEDITWTDFTIGGAFCVRPSIAHLNPTHTSCSKPGTRFLRRRR
jgi:hypothetical protein